MSSFKLFVAYMYANNCYKRYERVSEMFYKRT